MYTVDRLESSFKFRRGEVCQIQVRVSWRALESARKSPKSRPEFEVNQEDGVPSSGNATLPPVTDMTVPQASTGAKGIAFG